MAQSSRVARTMHYALHTVTIGILLWNIGDGENAAKTVASPEVLTTFAKNVASVLSPVLLGEFYPSRPNRSSAAHVDFKRSQKTRSTFTIKNDGISEAPNKNSSVIHERDIREDRFSKGRRYKEKFQDTYVRTNIPEDDLYNSKSRKSQDISLKRTSPVSRDIESDVTTDSDTNVRDSGKADVSGEAVHHFNRYRFPAYHHKPNFPFALSDPGYYGPFGFGSHYPGYNRYPSFHHGHQSPAASSGEPTETEGQTVENESTGDVRLPARSTGRPYDFDYGDQYYHPPFYRQPGFHGRPNSNGEQGDPEDERIESNTTEGQHRVRGYGYDPYGPPFYRDFYGPKNYDDPYNQGHPGNHTVDGQPIDRPGYGGFNHYPYHQPYYPNFYGHPREHPNENSGNGETSEDGQLENNSTSINHHHFGHPFKSGYGDFHFGGYPPFFNGLQGGHFKEFFHHKGHPYLNFNPYPYSQFGDPFNHFGGFYPNHNSNRPHSQPGNSQPANGDVDKSPDISGTPDNSETELISEGEAV